MVHVSPKMSNSLNPTILKWCVHVNPPDLLDTFAIFDWVCQCQIHFGCPLPNLSSVWSNFTNYEKCVGRPRNFSRLSLFIPAVAVPDPPNFHFNIAAHQSHRRKCLQNLQKIGKPPGADNLARIFRLINPMEADWGWNVDMPRRQTSQATDWQKKCF